MRRLQVVVMSALALAFLGCNAGSPAQPSSGAASTQTSAATTQPSAAATVPLAKLGTPDWQDSTPLPPPSQWWSRPGVYSCALPVDYRIDDGPVAGLGSCAAFLLNPPGTATLRVGQTLDLHASLGYPLPQSPDVHVLELVGTTDNGSSGSYEAVGPGTVVLMSKGLCLDTTSGKQTNGPCPVLKVTVTS